MGVQDNVIQRIMRHGDVSTTQKHYRKTLRTSVRKAMSKLDSRLKRDNQKA